MKKYEISLSSEAMEDLRNLFKYNSLRISTRRTAVKYVDGLFDTINSLRTSAQSFQLQTRPYFRKYGMFAYRVNYKKMAIIYTIHNDIVVIQEITPASMITGL